MKQRKLTKAMTNQSPTWTMDIATIRMHTGIRYLAIVMDESRVLGWSIAATVHPEWIRQRLEKTVNLHGTPKALYTDRSPMFCSDEHALYLKERGIGCNKKQSTHSIERLFGNLKQSHLWPYPKDEAELQERVQEYILGFNARRQPVNRT